MANIKKNFNFRNGVQVDDDNLLVTDTGLVGIGTTIPTEALDVRGNIVVTGFTSSPTAQIGVLTVTTFVPNQITGAGLSVFSGIVTASSGIITFYGDARFLQGMPTSQWEDTNTGLGVSSIYNTGGTVVPIPTRPVVVTNRLSSSTCTPLRKLKFFLIFAISYIFSYLLFSSKLTLAESSLTASIKTGINLS